MLRRLLPLTALPANRLPILPASERGSHKEGRKKRIPVDEHNQNATAIPGIENIGSREKALYGEARDACRGHLGKKRRTTKGEEQSCGPGNECELWRGHSCRLEASIIYHSCSVQSSLLKYSSEWCRGTKLFAPLSSSTTAIMWHRRHTLERHRMIAVLAFLPGRLRVIAAGHAVGEPADKQMCRHGMTCGVQQLPVGHTSQCCVISGEIVDAT